MNQRSTNFELLRILAIVFIVMEHFITQSELAGASGAQCIVNSLLGSGARIAVNVFVMLGAWFMVDAKFKAERIVRLYLELAFYSIPITLAMVALGQTGGARNIFQGLIPFFGRSLWFASAYISLVALSPFLNQVLTLPRRKLAVLLTALFVFFPVVATIPCSTPIDYLADFTWFGVLYLFTGWIKRENILNRLNLKWTMLCLGTAIYLALTFAATRQSLAPLAHYWLDNIKSLPNLICAFAVFSFTAKTDIGPHPSLNTCAKSIFAVYIIHQVPAFQHFEWTVLCQSHRIAEVPTIFYACLIPMVAIALFMVYSAVDRIRISLLEPLYMSTRPVKAIVTALDKLYSF